MLEDLVESVASHLEEKEEIPKDSPFIQYPLVAIEHYSITKLRYHSKQPRDFGQHEWEQHGRTITNAIIGVHNETRVHGGITRLHVAEYDSNVNALVLSPGNLIDIPKNYAEELPILAKELSAAVITENGRVFTYYKPANTQAHTVDLLSLFITHGFLPDLMGDLLSKKVRESFEKRLKEPSPAYWELFSVTMLGIDSYAEWYHSMRPSAPKATMH